MPCPCCDSNEAIELGTLGTLNWLRCRDCGFEYNQTAEVAEWEESEEWEESQEWEESEDILDDEPEPVDSDPEIL